MNTKPVKKGAPLAVRFTPKTEKQLRAFAYKERVSITAVVEKAVEAALAKR